MLITDRCLFVLVIQCFYRDVQDVCKVKDNAPENPSSVELLDYWNKARDDARHVGVSREYCYNTVVTYTCTPNE